jgi:hypothetical protein
MLLCVALQVVFEAAAPVGTTEAFKADEAQQEQQQLFPHLVRETGERHTRLLGATCRVEPGEEWPQLVSELPLCTCFFQSV